MTILLVRAPPGERLAGRLAPPVDHPYKRRSWRRPTIAATVRKRAPDTALLAGPGSVREAPTSDWGLTRRLVRSVGDLDRVALEAPAGLSWVWLLNEARLGRDPVAVWLERGTSATIRK